MAKIRAYKLSFAHWLCIAGVIGICIGVLGTLAYYHFTRPAVFNNGKCNVQFALTNPNLDCNYDDAQARLQTLDSSFDQAVTNYVDQGKATHVSVWVQDLSSKQWASTNENDTYSPASLLKLPLLIAYYKIAEVEPAILSQQIVYQKQSTTTDTNLYYTKQSTLVPGQKYSIDQLLHLAIIDSDNEAALTLYYNYGIQNFANILTDLGIKLPTSAGVVDYVTVKNYANIFRMLYNASYLNRDYSQKALSLMSQSTFKGIADPLPPSVTVAHKFGEQTVVNTTGTVLERELHDCGIVYKHSNTYSICIMTEGTNFNDLYGVLTGLSKLAFDQL